MTKDEQREKILTLVEHWAGSRENAEKWYQEVNLPPLGCTAKVAIENNQFDVLVSYIEAIGAGGYA
ncbi:hypothetical protein [Alteromonas ponticola]|uniref:DUF2384 domain-containing protein n=1 Tax=Alteromonas ponticola TaxID=2720613 RepID=A0ABX1R7B4_9ALTE|nr:hypothetical protein [Alteromonas ponticola]NMH61012.1 hypothetical protein [Alteromonas ponticola]